MQSPAVLKLDRVTLEIEGRKVLDDVTWDVLEGENWAIIGPNGAGKTSLISIVNAYRWPSSGAVTVLGRRFGEADLRELRTETGLVSTYLDEMVPKNERVIDLVMSGKFGSVRLWEKTDEKDRQRAAALLRLLGCVEHKGKKIKELSQGERQKVMIARALMSGAKLITLDEPCEGLDIASRETFLRGLDGLMGRRTTTLIEITHRTDDIPSGFTHALLLREGSVVKAGEIESTLTSGNLSRCFGTEVVVKRWGGRYYTVIPHHRGKRSDGLLSTP